MLKLKLLSNSLNQVPIAKKSRISLSIRNANMINPLLLARPPSSVPNDEYKEFSLWERAGLQEL